MHGSYFLPKTIVVYTNKFILSGIVGGIVIFFLGLLLMDFLHNMQDPQKELGVSPAICFSVI